MWLTPIPHPPESVRDLDGAGREHRAEQLLVEDRDDRVRLFIEFVLARCLLVALLWYALTF